MDTKVIIERHIAAFNARDRAADPWAVDAEMTAPGAALQGRDAVLAFLGVFQEAFPDGRLSVHRFIVDGADAAVEGRFVGTHDGVLRTPDGDVAATGRPVEFRWSASYETRGGDLHSEHLYFDQIELLGALGLLPA